MPAPRFAQLIRNRRVVLGLRQADVARVLGVATGEAVGMVETGRRILPIDRLPALAEVLQLIPCDLIMTYMREYHSSVAEIIQGAMDAESMRAIQVIIRRLSLVYQT
jgi:transcriptional regulator with XRE-family HTH domain